MDDKTKQQFILLFNQGFEEVVMPQIEVLREEMVSKTSLTNLEERLNTKLDRVENKLDNLVDKVNEHSSKIKTLEARSSVVSHSIKR